MKARVTVYPRPEIPDSQGTAIHQALTRMGFAQVGGVRVGKSFEVELDTADGKAAGELVEELCRRLLANPLVELYEIQLPGEGVEA